jgi:hypothetical protein
MENDQFLKESEKRSAELSSLTSKTDEKARTFSQESLDYKTIVEAKDAMTMILSNLLALQHTVSLVAVKTLSLNWLDDWRPFSFAGLNGQDIAAKQDHIELLALGFLMRYNVHNTTNYTPAQISWRRIITNPGDPSDLYNPLIMALEIYLNPAAARSSSGPGGGTGTVTPTPPKQPPPPGL